MIKCKNTDCIYGHCCVDCDSQKSKGGQCVSCDIAEDLDFDKEEILKRCKFSEPTNIKDATIKELWN